MVDFYGFLWLWAADDTDFDVGGAQAGYVQLALHRRSAVGPLYINGWSRLPVAGFLPTIYYYLFHCPYYYTATIALIVYQSLLDLHTLIIPNSIHIPRHGRRSSLESRLEEGQEGPDI